MPNPINPNTVTLPIKPTDHIADGVAKFRAATRQYTVMQNRVERAKAALAATQKDFEVARAALSALVGAGE
jgi:hypothetical protein